MRVFEATNEELKEIEDVVFDEQYFLDKSKKLIEESIAKFKEELKELGNDD